MPGTVQQGHIARSKFSRKRNGGRLGVGYLQQPVGKGGL